jgi:hypothetical protein
MNVTSRIREMRVRARGSEVTKLCSKADAAQPGSHVTRLDTEAVTIMVAGFEATIAGGVWSGNSEALLEQCERLQPAYEPTAHGACLASWTAAVLRGNVVRRARIRTFRNGDGVAYQARTTHGNGTITSVDTPVAPDTDEALVALPMPRSVDTPQEDCRAANGRTVEPECNVQSLRIVVLIKETVPAAYAVHAAAQGVLAGYLSFRESPHCQAWAADNTPPKLICKVTNEEFESAKRLPDHVVLTEPLFGGIEVAIAFSPRRVWPAEFSTFPIYG